MVDISAEAGHCYMELFSALSWFLHQEARVIRRIRQSLCVLYSITGEMRKLMFRMIVLGG